MPGALSAIAALLRQTPVILAAADALVSRTRRPQVTSEDLNGLRQRIVELEQHQHANAALAKDLADATTAIATAVQANGAKTRQALVIAIAAVLLAASALLVALLR
jgi:ribosomal 50S subunit-associated protein YjgA (DUF615 family)